MDQVNSPKHYVSEKGFEAIDVIEHCLSPEEYRGYLKGCIIKYLYRHNYKGNPGQDLKKAYWYLSRVIGEELHFDKVVKEPTPVESTESQNCECNCAECVWLHEQNRSDV